MSVENYRQRILDTILATVRERADVHGAWEGGSSATGTRDEFSDIDLVLVTDADMQTYIDIVQESLRGHGIRHYWQPSKSPWGEKMAQRVIVLEDSPDFFCVDLSAIDRENLPLIESFLEVERHGTPLVYFDKLGILRPRHTDPAALFERQMGRVNDLSAGFPIFKSLTLKELRRGKVIDAIGFYQNGLVRPFIEVLGMLRRPYRHDFGMRYIHKDFPPDEQEFIAELNYVAKPEEIPAKIVKIEAAFFAAVGEVKARRSL